MKFFKFIFFIFSVFVFSVYEDLSFTNADIFSPETKAVKEKEKEILNTESQTENKKIPNITVDEEQISEEELTVLSKDLELSKDTIIQNKKVVFNMVTIQTNEHDLTAIADEFISNHSIIKNFPEEQTAKEKEDGRSGGHVLIKVKTAKGSLLLTLSGENGGFVPQRKLSIREEFQIAGRNGENGYDAVYGTWCRDFYIPTMFGRLVLDRSCWNKCRVHPTRGQDGGNGRQGFTGYDGKRGGNSRLPDLIMDELFLKANSQFYEEVLSKLTPLEYLFKAKIDNPVVRKEMEKILKRKA